MRLSTIGFALLIGVMLCVQPATATELTFDQQSSISGSVAVDADYGDRVSTTSVGEASYRAGGGFTSRIVVDYGPSSSDPQVIEAMGDRVNVLHRGNPSSSLLEVTLTADPGFTVVLHGFDLVPVSSAGDGESVLLNRLSVLDGFGNEPLDQSFLLLDSGTSRRIEFDPPIEGSSLNITLEMNSESPSAARGGRVSRRVTTRDARGSAGRAATVDLARASSLPSVAQGSSGDVGIDNIRFAERGPIPFDERLPVRSVNEFSELALADLDGDGGLDVLSVTSGDDFSETVRWQSLLSLKEGFGQIKIIAEGAGAHAPITADFDGDGDVDVAVAWAFGGFNLLWYENLGQGSFGDARPINTPGNPTTLAVADLDRDGDPDILAGYQGAELVWHRNDISANQKDSWASIVIDSDSNGNGNGNGDSGHPTSIVSFDGDRDGDDDLLVGFSADPGAAYYENVGDLGFPSFVRTWILFEDDSRQVAAADLDRDGLDDAVIASCESNRIDWQRKSDDDDSETSDEFYLEREVASNIPCPEAVFVADLDNDGDIDVLSASESGGFLIHRNLGDGVFATASPPGDQVAASDVTAGDIDRDGDLDIVAATSGDNRIVWLPNKTIHRSSVYPGAVEVQSGVMFSQALAIDADQDGDLDVVGASDAAGSLDWFVNDDGAGQFIFPFEDSIAVDLASVRGVDTGQIDADGRPDLVSVGAQFNWYRNFEGFAFEEFTIAGSSVFTHAIATGDIGGDLRDDLVVSETLTPSSLAQSQGGGELHRLSWLRRGFDDEFISNFIAGLEQPVRAINLVDLDGDRRLDIVAGPVQLQGSEDTAVVYFPQRDLEGPDFEPERDVAGLDDVQAIRHGDVDGDGDLDLLIGAAGQLVWSENRLNESDPDPEVTGEDDFVVRTIDNEPAGTRGFSTIFAGDIDGDGDVDVAAAFYEEDSIRRYENLDGSGTRWAISELVASEFISGPRSIEFVDIDRDGDLDMFLAEDGAAKLSWHPNLGGQYGFEVAGPDSATLFEGESVLLLSVKLTTNAISGDSSSIVETLGLDLDDPIADLSLNADQMNAMIDRVEIYRDAENGEFDPNVNELIATIDRLDPEPSGLLALDVGDSASAVITRATTFHIAAVAAAGPGSAPFLARFAPERTVLRGTRVDNILSQQFGEDLTVFAAPIDTLRVDSFADEADAESSDALCSTATGECTLRAAIQEANDRPGADLVVLDAGTYTFTVPGVADGPDGAAVGDLDISDTVTIRGKGAEATIIDADRIDRVFDVYGSAELILEGLTIRRGGNSADTDGGAIRLNGSVAKLIDCKVTDNTTSGDGAAVFVDPGSSLLISRSRLELNGAAGSGAAIYGAGSVSIDSSTLAANSADGDGTLFVSGVLTLDNSTISGNFVSGAGGAISVHADSGSGTPGSAVVRSTTITQNTAFAGGAGLHLESGTAQLQNSILAGNLFGSDCFGTGLESLGFNLIQQTAGCALSGDLSTVLTAVDPLLGPLQQNSGHATETHALDKLSPAVDAGLCPDGVVGGRDLRRADLPNVPNALGGDGCDLGAREVPVGVGLPTLEIPVRWCVVEGSPSFDFASPSVQADVNDGLRARHESVNNAIYREATGIKFVSAANIPIPDYPILEDPRCVAGCAAVGPGAKGSVFLDPKARDYEELVDLTAACRAAWIVRDPSIVGITAVNINQFVDAAGQPTGLLGIGGRSRPGDAVMQAALGMVMVVDRSLVAAEGQPDAFDRVLAHEFGHAAGSLQHGDGQDNALDQGKDPDGQCANGVLDDDDDLCVPQPRFDGTNLMQYRTGVDLTPEQILQMRAHLEATIPELNGELLNGSLTDTAGLDDEKARVFDLEKARVFDLEKARVFDLEKARVFDLEKARVFDLEENEILDYEFANIYEFGMNIDENESQLYASYGGLPWPSPIRPATTFFWYLDLDQSETTGALPQDHGFPTSQQPESGVDVIARVDLFSECTPEKVCSDSALLTIYSWDDAMPQNGFVVVVDEQPIDGIDGLDLGLVQATNGEDPEREQPAVGMLIRLPIDNALLTGALPAPGYELGDTIEMEVLTALPCKSTLPSGDELDCQCLSCGDCPGYPGCDETGLPVALGVCLADGIPCRTDLECLTPDDVCEFGLIVFESPGGTLSFEPPVFPSCEIESGAAEPGGSVSIVAGNFPTGTGRGFRVVLDGVEIGSEPAPVFVDGIASLSATLPAELLAGELELTVRLEEFATTADCTVSVVIDDGRRFFSTTTDQFAPGIGTMRGEHVYALDLEEGTFTEAVPPFLTTFLGLDAIDLQRDGSLLFSVARNGGLTHAGGFSSLKEHRVYRRTADGVVSLEFDWGGVEVGSLDAIDLLSDGTYVFSTKTLRGATHAGGFIVLRPQNAYRFEPASGLLSLVFDGQQLGLSDLDGIDFPGGSAGGRVGFSTATRRFVTTAGGALVLEHQNAYVYDPLLGTVTLALDGEAVGLRGLDAVDLGQE